MTSGLFNCYESAADVRPTYEDTWLSRQKLSCNLDTYQDLGNRPADDLPTATQGEHSGHSPVTMWGVPSKPLADGGAARTFRPLISEKAERAHRPPAYGKFWAVYEPLRFFEPRSRCPRGPRPGPDDCQSTSLLHMANSSTREDNAP